MASLGGLEIEYEMSLPVDHLKNLLFDLTQVHFVLVKRQKFISQCVATI